MSIYDDHPADHWVDIFIEDYLLAREGKFFYGMNQVIARIASPEPTGAEAAASSLSPPAAAGEAVGACGSYPPDMKKQL